MTNLKHRITFVAMLALAGAALAAPAMAGSTGWLDRDNPGGSGDYEDVKSHFKIKCRIKGSTVAAYNANFANRPGYTCKLPVGGYCKNSNVKKGKCRDMEVKYSWSGGSTPWLDRDNPSGVGDYEDFKSHFKIKCRIKGLSQAASNAIIAGAGYTCKLPVGGYCKNSNVPNGRCKDMEVRYIW